MSDETDRQEAVAQAHVTGVAAATSLGEGLSRKADRGDVWKVAFVASLFAIAGAVFISAQAAQDIVDVRAEQAATESRRDAERERTRQAIEALQEANRELTQRGQQPVYQPPDIALGEALVAATAARVLADLPPAPAPTDTQLANAIAAHMLVNPVSVPPSAVASQVASYLAANPPAAGPKGEKGEKGEPGVDGTDGTDGRTPTAEEIMAVFNQAVAANPDLLCAGKGKFTEVRGFIQVAPDPAPTERAFWVCLPQ
jgi:uncharacterized membrane protein